VVSIVGRQRTWTIWSHLFHADSSAAAPGRALWLAGAVVELDIVKFERVDPLRVCPRVPRGWCENFSAQRHSPGRNSVQSYGISGCCYGGKWQFHSSKFLWVMGEYVLSGVWVMTVAWSFFSHFVGCRTETFGLECPQFVSAVSSTSLWFRPLNEFYQF
jgi:hypothetical protein